MSVHSLTSDRRVQGLKYKYIEGDKEPKDKRQSVEIFYDLSKLLHSEGYIHTVPVTLERKIFCCEEHNHAWIG